MYACFAAWQFLGDGWLFNIGYYFSSFLVPTLLLPCGRGGGAGRRGRLSIGGRLSRVACAVAVLTPVAWIYESDSATCVATSYGADSYIAMFVVMGLALVLAAFVRVPRFRAIGAAAVADSDSSPRLTASTRACTTLGFGSSDTRTGGLYVVGQKLIAHMRANGYEKELPRTWYDGEHVASGIGSIQSLYYYAFTHLDVAMPTINDDIPRRAWRERSSLIALSFSARTAVQGR